MVGKILELKIKTVEVVIKYHLRDDTAKEILIGGEYDVKAWQWVVQNMPLQFNQHIQLKKRYKGIQATVKPANLSFERFWAAYDNKIGKKQAAGQIWSKMSQQAKVAALLYIKTLKRKYKAKEWDLPLGDSYLRGKYWEAQN